MTQGVKRVSLTSWTCVALSCFIGVIACSSLARQIFSHSDDDVVEAAFNILQTLPSDYSECGSNFTLYQITDGSSFVKITINNNCDQTKFKSCEVLYGNEAKNWAQVLQRYIIDGGDAINDTVSFPANGRDFDVLLQACQQIMQLDGVITKLDTDVKLSRRTRQCTYEPTCDTQTRNREGFTSNDRVSSPPVSSADEAVHSNKITYDLMLNGIYPGTLWCGVGNIADDVYTRFGLHRKADECCRNHDLCKPTIRKFQGRYQLFNPTLLRMSHCSCDREFYNCLKRAKTEAATDIGDLFFNKLRLQCFEFDFMDTCTWYLFGICLRSEFTCAAKVGRITDF
ncbi:uncharacterized protein LOC117112586 [Anneissia japonica]|uniref:uncharacterized protein LOC117112586 n=1 Tax=Anneissia japonica TaxID=1529436 RepID=UPI0014255F1D|nr:uncharacterized protein LOC117112586 [Anneissia japonica]XP_033111575.1 uncharacterized protein LOC117112586 [Anneissia japonica]